MDSLLQSVEQNNLPEVQKSLSIGSNINAIDIYGYSALHIASFKRLNEMAIFLIDRGIDVNLRDKNGQTILHFAALYDQLNIASTALNKGAMLNMEDVHGNEPLWTAVFNDKGRNDRFEMIKLFLKHGADVDHKNKVGKSPRDLVEIVGAGNLKPLLK